MTHLHATHATHGQLNTATPDERTGAGLSMGRSFLAMLKQIPKRSTDYFPARPA